MNGKLSLVEFLAYSLAKLALEAKCVENFKKMQFFLYLVILLSVVSSSIALNIKPTSIRAPFKQCIAFGLCSVISLNTAYAADVSQLESATR